MPYPMRRSHVRAILLCLSVSVLQFRASAADEVIAVSSKVSKDYVRQKFPDGSFKPETYAFAQGDNWGGARVDPTLDRMDFMDVARVLAVPLAKKSYVPTADPKTTRLLVLVTWGTTRAPEHASDTRAYDQAQDAAQKQLTANTMLRDALTPSDIRIANGEVNDANGRMMGALEAVSAEDRRREDTDRRTAALLGYDSWWAATIQDVGGTGLGYKKQDMMNELEEDRYFVVVTALDYPLLVKEKKSKMLWETRFSIREHGNAFDSRIAGMAELASNYFGRDSKGLHHDDLPQGNVEIGPVRSLGVVPAK
jgi:hypothetical protein